MGNLEIITLFVVCLNIFMFISGAAMLDVNPSGSICYNIEGTVIDNTILSSGNYSVLDNDVISDLPEVQGAISTDTGTNIFTDIFNNILGWFKSTPGLRYVYGVVAAPYNILKCLNLPSAFSVAIGTLWYLVSLLVLIAFISGR